MADAITSLAQSTDQTLNVGNPMKALGRVIGQYQEESRRQEADPDIKRIRERLPQEEQNIEEKYQGVQPLDVPDWNAQQQAAKFSHDPIQSFGSFASILLTLASAFTKKPLVNSLNAATASINAVKAGDRRAYEDAYKAWKDNTELALKRHEVQHEAFKDALEKLQTEPELMKVYAAQYGDRKADLLASAGMVKELGSLQMEQARLGVEMKKASLDIEMKRPAINFIMAQKEMDAAQKSGNPAKIDQAQNDYLRAAKNFGDFQIMARAGAPPNAFTNPVMLSIDDGQGGSKNVMAQQDRRTGQWVTADEKRMPIEGAINIIKGTDAEVDPKSVDEMAKLIAGYKVAPLSSFALKGKYGQNVMARVSELNPTYNGALFSAHQKASRDFSTGKQGDAVRSFNVAISHLDTFSDLIDALDNHDLQAFNRLANKTAEETGSPAPTNFDAAKQIIGQEIVKAIIGGGGGVTERQQAAESISRADSPEQLRGVIQTYQHLMTGQLQGYRRQYQQATGMDNFDDLLSPEVKEKLSGGAQPKYSVGQILTRGGKKYRVIGIDDPNDPDVDEVSP